MTAGAVIADKIMKALGWIGGKAAGTAGTVANKAFEVGPGLALGAASILGLGAGYGLARLREPSSVAENSDKILESEALATEIAVTEKKLKALEARRRERRARQKAEQPYDRVV